MIRTLAAALLAIVPLAAADYQAGVAGVVINPSQPIYMSGYAARKHASEGVYSDLKAKALVIKDHSGKQIAVVTADLIGFPRSVSDLVAARVEKAYGIDRAHLVLNASH